LWASLLMTRSRKGLDLALEVFARRTDIELFVCGLDTVEKVFAGIYAEAFMKPNIHNLGFVKMEHEDFRKLMSDVSAFIFPTIWEGGGGAALNLVGNAGLVPIVSRNLGLEFNNQEYLVEDFTADALERAVDDYLRLNESSLQAKSEALKKYISERHTYPNYRASLKKILEETIK